MIEHDYDPVSDAVVSWHIEPGASIIQEIAAPDGWIIDTVAMKMRRHPSLTGLEFRIGSSPGAGDLAYGSMSPVQVGLRFERWVNAPLSSPLRVPDGGRLFLWVGVPADSPGGCSWFGTADRPIPRAEFHTHFGYVSPWTQDASVLPGFENPMNIDYGTRTPHYVAGRVWECSGAPISGLSLAFRIGHDLERPVGQDRFAFIDEVTGPLHTRSLRRDDVRPAEGEVSLHAGWSIVDEVGGPVVRTAASEFADFLAVAMDCRVGGGRSIRLRVDEGSAPAGVEAFQLDVAPDAVDITARSARGVMCGLHYAEALMRCRRAPLLPIGSHVRRPRWPVRITCAAFDTGRELTGPMDAYSDGLLGRISRAGFNGIWVLAELSQLGRSAVYPELDDHVAEHQMRLSDLIQRAARWGIDVYVCLFRHPRPEAFFGDHPQVRGSTFQAYGGANVCCAGTPEVQTHIRACATDLMQKLPGLAGLSVIVGGEGFLHCYTRQVDCPRCRERPAAEAVAEAVRPLVEGVRSVSADAVVAVWPYSASNWWSRDDPTQSGLIAALPMGATLLTEFAKEGTIEIGGRPIAAYDYPLCIPGPSERFVKQKELAHSRGLPVWVKTEHAIALEFIATPYIPAFAQWLERFTRLPDGAGVFGNWMHYGFMPTRAGDLFWWSVWTRPPEPGILLRLAMTSFGPAAAGHVVAAWEAFSQAISNYPFSAEFALGPIQSGPAHPFFPHTAYEPRYAAGRQFANDLKWTEPWGPGPVLTSLERMAESWECGMTELRAAGDVVDRDDSPELEAELSVSATMLAAVRTTLHLGRFFLARAELDDAVGAQRTALITQIRALIEAERANCQRVLPYVRADSRLGYANPGGGEQTGVPRGGLFSPASITKKIAQLDRLLVEEYPRCNEAPGGA